MAVSRLKRIILLGPMLQKRPKWMTLIKRLEITRKDYLIGVDQGTALGIKLGLLPDLAIGDWDSLVQKSILKKITNISLPVVKDRSDLSYALYYALMMGAGKIYGWTNGSTFGCAG